MSKPAMLVGEGDPRLSQDDTNNNAKGFVGATAPGSSNYTRPQNRRIHDPDVTFEEYYYYAKLTRAEELENVADMGATEKGMMSLIFPSKTDAGVRLKTAPGQDMDPNEKRGSLTHNTLNLGKQENRAAVSDEEWTNASRALRTASWGAIFYLITTDILGPFALPYALATLGWGPGITLYTIFAILAGYSGWLIWGMFMDLDSYEFPLRSYGDMGYRVFGAPARWLFNGLQAVQLILNVGIITISNGEAFSQAVKFNVCFAVCCLIWALVGFVFGQVRTLQKFGWLANLAVWLNIMCCLITMGGAAKYGPNYAAADLSAGAAIDANVTQNPDGSWPPVVTSAGDPDTASFIGAANGAMQAVFAYGGAMIFPEFLSEMKHPKDFLKGMWAAQTFIWAAYIFYGAFLYGYQGQYVVNPSYLGISQYGIQTAGNVFAIVSAVIAAALYGNIGIKVIYNNIFVEWFKAPPLTMRTGKFAWMALVPIYWGIAFVIAAGIPNFAGLTGVVAAFCILHFTYSFPPIMSVMHNAMKYSMREGDGFDPATGVTTRRSGLAGRLMVGFISGPWYINIFNILFFLGALAMSGLGAYASIEILKAAFADNTTNSFVCKSPLDGAIA